MPNVVNFDPTSLRIVEIGVGGDNEIDIREIYSEWKDWQLADPLRMGYPPAFRVVGGDPISDTESLGSTFFLLDPWKIRPAELDHQLTLVGNLFTDPAGESPIVPTLGGYTVDVSLKISTLVESVSGGSGGLTSQQTAAAVWGALSSAHADPGTFGEALGTLDVNAVADAIQQIQRQLTRVGISISGATVPASIYAGQKGETVRLQIYRDGVPIDDAELAGATGITVVAKNLFTDASYSLSGTLATGGAIEYVTVPGDGVGEEPGDWQFQAQATLADSSLVISELRRQVYQTPVSV